MPETWILFLSLVSLGILFPLREALSGVDPLLFLASFVLFLTPGAVLCRLLLREETEGIEIIPPAFVFSAGGLGLLAVAALTLKWPLELYLGICGTVLAISLVVAAILVIRGSASGASETTDGSWLLWLPFGFMGGVLSLASLGVVHPPNADTWRYLIYVREFLEVSPLGASVSGRYAINGWVTEQAALSKLSGLDPVNMTLDYLVPVMTVVSVLAIYWLSRVLFESRQAALFAGCIATLSYLIQIDDLQQLAGSQIIAHSAQDKFVTWYTFLPMDLGLAILFMRTRKLRYLGLFTLVCWSVVIIHPMGLLSVGMAVTGFILAHLAVSPRSWRSWRSSAALGVAMSSIGLPPAIYLLGSGSPLVSKLASEEPGTSSVLLSITQNSERLMVLDGGQYIMHPSFLLNPIVLTAYVLGVPFLIWRLRRSLTAQLLLGTLLFTPIFIYVPQISTLIGKIIGPWSLWRLTWPVQLAALLTVGWLVWELLRYLGTVLGRVGLERAAPFLPILAISVLMATAAPPALAGLRSANGEGETPQEESSCMDPAFRWMQGVVREPGTVVLAPDRENSCFPAYTLNAEYVAYRTGYFPKEQPTSKEGTSDTPEIPRNILDVRKFFGAAALDGEMVEILERYSVDMIILTSSSPLNEQLERLPGFEPMDNPGGRYRFYRVNEKEMEITPLVEANGLLNDGEIERAIEAYGAVLDGSEDERLLAYLGLGRVYPELKQPEEAVANLEEAARLAPRDPGVHHALAQAHIAAKDMSAAREALKKAVSFSPRDVSLRLELGSALQRMKKHREAVAQYREVVEMFPKVPEYRAELGKALNLAKDFGAADREFERAVRLNPRSASLHGLLGLSNKASGQPEKAAEYYEGALDLDPGNELYTLQLGLIHAELSMRGGKDRNYFELAERELKTVSGSDSSLDDTRRKTAYFALGNLYARWREPEKAVSAYEQVLKMDPDFRSARQKLERLEARR